MEEKMLPHLIVLRMKTFSGSGDFESHLKSFRVQMLISGGFDIIRCKIFVGTFIGTALQWFSGIPFRAIDSFHTFS